MYSVGIDLSSSPKRASIFAGIDCSGTLTRLSLFKEAEEMLSMLEERRPEVVGIDAPLSLPSGLHCLEESCPCKATNGLKGRAGEVELAQMGIGCFFTSKKSIIKPLIYRGVKYRKLLEEKGYKVIEAYPYATKVMLFGDQMPSKNKPEALEFLRTHLPSLARGVEEYAKNLNHDKCDAILTAYTARLFLKRETDSLGDEEEGAIAVPRLQRASRNGRPVMS
jgi:predicted nuclease with RNAse H fold